MSSRVGGIAILVVVGALLTLAGLLFELLTRPWRRRYATSR